jgi:hypothetical protein
VSEAQVQTEATQGAQPSGKPVDLHVPVHRLLAYAAGCLALRIEAIRQVGDRLLEGLRGGREVLLVAGDQRRVGLGGEVVGQVKRAGSQGFDVIRSDLRLGTLDPFRNSHFRGFWPRPAILLHDPGLAATPPPGALHVESEREWVLSLPTGSGG